VAAWKGRAPGPLRLANGSSLHRVTNDSTALKKKDPGPGAVQYGTGNVRDGQGPKKKTPKKRTPHDDRDEDA
jgi:hypothetical protein